MSLPDAKYHYKRDFPETFKEAFEDLMRKNGEFKDQDWFRQVKFAQVEKGYYSDDNMAGIYICGLKTVVENYMDDVVRFYNG